MHSYERNCCNITTVDRTQKWFRQWRLTVSWQLKTKYELTTEPKWPFSCYLIRFWLPLGASVPLVRYCYLLRVQLNYCRELELQPSLRHRIQPQRPTRYAHFTSDTYPCWETRTNFLRRRPQWKSNLIKLLWWELA